MGKKRGQNEGTITQRKDGRWEARVTLPDGRRKCYYGETRQEVASKMYTALRDIEGGLPITGDRQTVAQYLEGWLETVKPNTEPGTYRRYNDFVRLHLVPTIGKVVLSKLSGQQVQLCMSRLLNKGLSTTTVHNIHAMLHKALKDALLLGLVQRNVTEMVKAPRRQHHEMMTLTEDQARAMLAAVADDRFEAVYVLALSTGMREGEIFALRWQDVDLKAGALVVRQTIKEAEKGYMIGKTKTVYSRRRILLAESAIESLKQHRQRQEAERSALGEAWESSMDLVFPNTVGGRIIPDNFVKRHFKPLLKGLKLPGEIRFHDLRHTCATLLLSKGVNVKVVSEMLGHSDVSITLRIYSHVLPGMQKEAAEIMNSVIRNLF